ncbi:MAG: hypothetical protein KGZ75_01085 [Syntrophomonadaceae bacterium]|nr:hypothetical protein [Syntrophomonadaceae bacterium]
MVQKLSFISLIFHAIPEGIALTALVWSFLKLPFQWKSIVFIGFLHGIISYFVRLLPVSFGIHTALLIFGLTILICVWSKTYFSTTLFRVVFAVFILALGEVVIGGSLLAIFNISWDELQNSQWIRVLLGTPNTFFILVIALSLNQKTKAIHTERIKNI